MSAVKKWRIPSQADSMLEQVRGHLAAIGAGEDVTEADLAAARDRCSWCGREKRVCELADASVVPELGGGHACGACREKAIRLGRISSAEWARRAGAPTAVVEKLARKDAAIRSERQGAATS